ncbi:MAG: glycosyltransferase [Candidatus ainarchaeum sp.]|nr:glycosyltransferase [Candidatus ainarchaeum sp.]
MKIAVFTDTYLPQTNGVVTYLVDSLRLLSKNNKVVLFAPGGSEFRVEQRSPRMKIYWIPASPFPFYEGYRIASFNYGRVSGILKREKPDIVHAHAPVPLGLQGLLWAKRHNVPSVVTYHTHFPDYLPHLLNGRLPGFLHGLSHQTVRQLIYHVFKNVSAVTAPTHELCEELRSYGLRNVAHLPNGVDFRRFRGKPADGAVFRRRHKIGRRRVVLYVGRISFEKRLDVLLEAFSMIENSERVLVVVGSGPYMGKLKELAAALGMKGVIFTGYVKDAGAAYRCADVFASASDTETFGMTFVEAMHAGLPVIGVRMLGAKEVITPKCGLLVEPGSPGEMGRAMEKLLDDKKLRAGMAKEAPKRAMQYSMDKSVKRTLEIYRGLLRGG